MSLAAIGGTLRSRIGGITLGDIIDITTRLPQREPGAEIAAATWRAAAYYGAICSAGSLAPVGDTVHTGLRCHRRPRHRRCPGYLVVFRSDDQSDDIDWRCLSCGDSGTICGWRGSDRDLSHTEIIKSDASDQCAVDLTEEENELLQSLLPADTEIERVVLGGRRTAPGIRLTGRGIELENLQGFVALVANDERQRRRRAQLDQICARIERALERCPGTTTPLAIDAHLVAAHLLASDISDPRPEVQRLVRYVWARVALDYGILVLIGEEHVNGVDRLICALQEDGSSYVVEQPPGWGLADEARYVAPVKAILGGAQS